MHATAQELTALLEQEKLAATQADYETLLSLQPRKQELVSELSNGVAPAELVEPIAQAMSQNLALMRNLHRVIEGILSGGEQDLVYGSSGRPSSRPRAHIEGTA